MKANQFGLQESFKRAYNAIYNANLQSGMSPDQATAAAQNAVLSQSYLRLEAPLDNGKTNFSFPILVNETTNNVGVSATEVRLAQQDSFFASAIAVYLTTQSATATNGVLLTYPNPVSFATGAASLYSFYNGFISVTINKSVIIPHLNLSAFLQVPQTQQTAATNSPLTEFDPSEVYLFEPNINFVGTKSSVINAVLPGNIATIDANTKAVIIIYGILAQNVTLMS